MIRLLRETWGTNFGIVCALMILLTASAWGADEAGPINANFETTQVSEVVYVVHGPKGFPSPTNQGFMNNPAFVLTSAGVVIIDSGSSIQVGKMVLEKIRRTTDMPVVSVFSTHIHGDHWLGNQAVKEQYPEISMYAHPELIERAHAGRGQFWVDLMLQMTERATRGTEAVIPDKPVNDGDVIIIGDTRFFILHKGKAHTESDISILVQPGNVLFTGDLVFNQRLGRMDDGSFLGLIETLDYLIKLNPDVVVPGHGLTGEVSIISNTHRLHSRLYQTVEQKFEEGLTDFEMKDIVIEELNEFADWDGFESGIGRLISLSYLEVEENNF